MAKDSHTISEIHFEAPDRVVLYTTAYPLALHMGWGDWEGKVQRVDRVLKLWKGHEERLLTLDASFGDQDSGPRETDAAVNERVHRA